MADTKDGRSEEDVAMADAEVSIKPTNGSNSDAGILKSVEQPSGAQASTSLDIKSEPYATQPSSPSPTATKMPKPAPKKKGTAAATKKGPKRPKSTKPKAPKKENASGEPQQDDDDDSSDDEIDNGPYCLCRGPDDHRWMISCDVCEDWFHGECVDLSKEFGEKLVERFVCPNCTDGKLNYTKYKKTCSFGSCTNAARLYGKKDTRSVFCSNDHCDAWWAAMIGKLPTKVATRKALEVLTQEDFVGLLASTANDGGWKLGDQPFGNIEGLWVNGLPTRPGVLSDEEQKFLQTSAAERLSLGNEIVQYKKMMQLIDWANQRRQTAIELGKLTKDSCGYDNRLDVVSVRHAFVAWIDSPEGQAIFTAGKLDTPVELNEGDEATMNMCEKKRCKAHNGWYKILTSAVRNQVKETATAAADKLEAEEVLRQEAETRFERRQLEKNWVQVIE
ncbi:hypothetical protein BKA67DRAFT_537687 [Truncatella angustata]|uniref:PHD-type domain-containing protein n=1 Tax=Truncatella angustata TaxID=152316 RepID=A0A9P8UGM6_9PEZI|nr:uncharacterized protein BKA67DRAFT_537687 [Truncatella angustata]KAH6651835.1 hypothetical protein BKA67DRAFT_537687 [Truncatella angustata]KAH8193748.1 hypothetical protein TruAng_012089 [Truncatella angustata]